MHKKARRQARALPGICLLVGMVAIALRCQASPHHSPGDDYKVDIIIDLPQDGSSGGQCRAGVGGKTTFDDAYDNAGHGVRGQLTVIPPDFSQPLQLPDTTILSPAGVTHNDICADSNDCWLDAYSRTKMALAASEVIFRRFYHSHKTPPPLCTLVVTVHIHSYFIAPNTFGGIGSCPGKGPIIPKNPTVCLTWPDTTDNTDWRKLLKERLKLYAKAQNVLDSAVNNFLYQRP